MVVTRRTKVEKMAGLLLETTEQVMAEIEAMDGSELLAAGLTDELGVAVEEDVRNEVVNARSWERFTMLSTLPKYRRPKRRPTTKKGRKGSTRGNT